MITKYKNRILQFGGSMSFYVTGNFFPASGMSFSSTSTRAGTINRFFSITIDYNDGTSPVTYNSVGVTNKHVSVYPVGSSVINPAVGWYSGKAFADGNKADRLVTITCSDWSAITSFGINALYFSRPQVLGVPFRLMKNLVSFSATNGFAAGGYAQVTELDPALFTLPYMTTFQLGGVNFLPTSRYYGYLQPQWLNPNLVTFLIGGPGYAGKTFTDSNLRSINAANLPNLVSLGMNAGILANDDNGFGEGAFPVEWTTLNKLVSFNVAATRWTKMPDRLNLLSPTLQVLLMAYMPIAEWAGDLSRLLSLTTITLTGCNSFTNTLPAYLSVLTQLKSIGYAGVSYNRSVGWIDALVDNWYSFIVAHAALTGSAAMPFRGMSFDVRSVDPVNTPSNAQVPSGTYQAPAGFSLGVDNGQPVSSLEKIYVLENQYAHKWLYRVV